MTGDRPAAGRRPFAWRAEALAGARFVTIDDAAVADGYGEPPEAESRAAATLGLADLSPLPRYGFKGRDALGWLARAGAVLPGPANQAVRQPDGTLIAKLAETEALILPDPFGPRYRPPPLPEGGDLLCFAVPRRDASLWFRITGAAAPPMLAKLCGVDLRPHRFAPLAVAQTSLARMSGIVIRDDVGAVTGYHLLADSASAAYLWRCLHDAMGEFGGRPVGLAGLRRLADDRRR